MEGLKEVPDGEQSFSSCNASESVGTGGGQRELGHGLLMPPRGAGTQ